MLLLVVVVVVLVRAGGYPKMKKSWRGVGGEGAAPPPQCTRCKECIADVDLEVLCCVVVVVVVVVAVVVVACLELP